jgi:uncharacterized protein (TIGR00725 family)
MPAKTLIGVIGAAEPNDQEKQSAFEVGRLIGELKLDMVCGGLGGVMAEASRGCREAGGTVIGILPTGEKQDANPHVTYAIPTNLGHARNVLIAHSADLLVAIGTGYGTLSEIAIALKLGKKVLGLHSWEIPGVTVCQGLRDVERVLREQYL